MAKEEKVTVSLEFLKSVMKSVDDMKKRVDDLEMKSGVFSKTISNIVDPKQQTPCNHMHPPGDIVIQLPPNGPCNH